MSDVVFRYAILLVLLAAAGGGGRVVAQAGPAAPDSGAVLGRPVVRTLSPQAYDGNGLVWDIVQDDRGLLYLASSYGLQQYDGARWRALPTGNGTTPQAVARDADGALHVGAEDELGVYRPDSLGRLRYRSLLPEVPASHRPVGAVWPVVAAGEAVYYRTQNGVLRGGDGEMQVVTDSTRAEVGVFACRDTAVLQAADGRLYRIDGTALAPLDGGARFEGTSITTVLPGRAAGCEVITEQQGRFVLTDAGVERRPLPGGPMDAPVVAAVRGPGGAWALATEWTLRLIGPNGTRHRLVRADGRIPGEIKALHVSRRQALWVATTEGIARVAWPDPVTLLRAPPALQAITGRITRHDGALAAGTEKGLWRVGRDTIRHLASDGHTYGVLSTRSGLLAAGSGGLFVYRDGRARRLADTRTYALHRSRRDSAVVYATGLDGEVLRLRRRADRWRVADRTDRFEVTLPTVAEAPDGALWLGTGYRGVLRLGPPLDDLDAAPVARFDTADGLPTPGFNFTTQLGDSVRFATADGLYRFTGASFVPDARLRPAYADGVTKSWFAEYGDDGGVWMDFGGHKLGVARGWPADSVRWVARPFRRVADVGDVWSIYPDHRRSSLVWFGADGALVRYDRRLQRHGGHAQSFRTLVRGVRTRDDSLLYGGDTGAATLPAPVAHADNRLRFQFGSTSFEQIDGPLHGRDRPRQYRWRLAGFDDGWTDWTTEAHADYTGLGPGRYTLHVEARNLYDVVGTPATLSFTVRPPWYRTWWAYGGYALLALGLVAGAVQWRTRRLRRRQEELEATVAERTEQIRRKNDELARQAEKLKALDEAKSRFFANVSHEFRTPLTLIRGPVQAVRERLRGGDAPLDEAAEQLAMVERNTDRLRRLVDQLLALARLDAGAYELNARPLALDAEVRRIARPFEGLAERHGLTLRVTVEEGPDADLARPVVDPAALEHILGNLLSNALKFTPEGGRVDVTVTGRPDAVEVAVADTGPGIPEAEQDGVFERFQQADAAPTGDETGLGIGLAFAKDLVTLHGGAIDLESAEGEGTTVTVRFPRGPDHLADEKIATPRPADEAPPTASPDDDGSPSSASSPSTLDPRPASPSDPAVPPSPAADGGGAAGGDTATDDRAPVDTPQSKIVLVVDDNADVRAYVRSVLEPAYAVIEAADGADGLDRAREDMPDVILADVMMPTMDGVEMTRRLRRDPATDGIPIVMLTARAGAEHEVEGLEAGADDYVVKPFDADVLRARVAGMIDVRRRLRRRIEAELARRGGDGQAGDGDEGPRADGPVEERAGGDQRPDAAPPRLVVPTASDDEPDFVQEVRAAIEDRLADPDLSVEQLASAVAVSRSTLYRRLKEQADCTPSQFLQRVRIEHGARLLREQEGTVSEVAYAVGFDSLSYFSRQFREHVGQSPSEYVAAVG
jgi:signal transduction histidine kinase/CheY-like chemotaxis protein/predicted DNA-binding transcriptional regulator AlpA